MTARKRSGVFKTNVALDPYHAHRCKLDRLAVAACEMAQEVQYCAMRVAQMTRQFQQGATAIAMVKIFARPSQKHNCPQASYRPSSPVIRARSDPSVLAHVRHRVAAQKRLHHLWSKPNSQRLLLALQEN
jgi:hypothetical protein